MSFEKGGTPSVPPFSIFSPPLSASVSRFLSEPNRGEGGQGGEVKAVRMRADILSMILRLVIGSYRVHL